MKTKPLCFTSKEPCTDRKDWPKGEWDNEPEDRYDFESAGFPCFIHRSRLGNWCGYVGIPESHPYFGKDYSGLDLEVHGGLTFASKCREGDHLCHIPKPGQPDNIWWLGFDCAHGGDLIPGITSFFSHMESYETYKNKDFAMKETFNLAQQLSQIK